jgi:hypothetical protein
MPRYSPALIPLVCLLALPAAEVPFGSADWKASPTDAVGFAGQGNNYYPGATPPTEFWEGTPVEAEVKDDKGKVSKQWTYADQKSKNILWKVAVPGGSESLTSPHYVTCYDADTGKVVWQDELKLMTLPVLDKDRKSISPAPEAAKAATQQGLLLFQRTLGWWRARLGATAKHRNNNRRPIHTA